MRLAKKIEVIIPHLTPPGRLAQVTLLSALKSGPSHLLCLSCLALLPQCPCPLPILAFTTSGLCLLPGPLQSPPPISTLPETQLCAEPSGALTEKRMKSELWLAFQTCHQPRQHTLLLSFQRASEFVYTSTLSGSIQTGSGSWLRFILPTQCLVVRGPAPATRPQEVLHLNQVSESWKPRSLFSAPLGQASSPTT